MPTRLTISELDGKKPPEPTKLFTSKQKNKLIDFYKKGSSLYSWWDELDPFKRDDLIDQIVPQQDSARLKRWTIFKIGRVEPVSFAAGATSKRNLEVVARYYAGDVTLTQIAKEYNISRPRVRQIISQYVREQHRRKDGTHVVPAIKVNASNWQASVNTMLNAFQ